MDGPSAGIGAVVDAVARELVDEIAVRAVNLGAVLRILAYRGLQRCDRDFVKVVLAVNSSVPGMECAVTLTTVLRFMRAIMKFWGSKQFSLGNKSLLSDLG